MKAKKKKTAFSARKIFDQSLKAIQRRFEDDGEIDCYPFAAVDLLVLLEDVPRKKLPAAEMAICSALWACDHSSDFDATEVSESCVGGQLFLVAYTLGRFSILEGIGRKKRSEISSQKKKPLK